KERRASAPQGRRLRLEAHLKGRRPKIGKGVPRALREVRIRISALRHRKESDREGVSGVLLFYGGQRQLHVLEAWRYHQFVLEGDYVFFRRRGALEQHGCRRVVYL